MTRVCGIADTDYGPMIVPLNDTHQTDALLQTRRAAHHAVVAELAELLDAMPPGRTVVDAGANLGAFTMGLAPRVDGWLHAFEPQPVVANMLAGSVALSQRQNVRVHCVCLGDPPDGVDRIAVPQFDYRRRMSYGSVEFGPEQVEHLGFDRGDDPARVEHVPYRPLDWYRLERLDLVKVDVQRMEVEMLAGARATLARCRPTMLIEWQGHDEVMLRAAIASHGYAVERAVGPDDWLCLPA